MKDRKDSINDDRRVVITGKQLRELAKMARKLHVPFRTKNPAGKAPLKGNI